VSILLRLKCARNFCWSVGRYDAFILVTRHEQACDAAAAVEDAVNTTLKTTADVIDAAGSAKHCIG
jgi:hypothetical protein